MYTAAPTASVDVKALADPRYQRALFARGYLISRRAFDLDDGFPFFGNWSRTRIGAWVLHAHCQTSVHLHSAGELNLVLIGHAYNPSSRVMDESLLLAEAASRLATSADAFHACIAEWTGRFVLLAIRGAELMAVQDCAGMRALFYGEEGGIPYLCSHAQLLADLLGLEMAPWIRKLVNAREYKVGIRFLPGNVSPFPGVRRLGPNTVLAWREAGFSVQRFYPLNRFACAVNDEEQSELVKRIAEILRASLEITAAKWKSPAVSLTGGTDSQATLAASVTSRDRMRYFTFASSVEEARDLDAASKLAKRLGLDHHACLIPDSGDDLEGYEELSAIVRHNAAYVRENAPNDLRKLTYFTLNPICEVDVKSWVSEIGRSNFSKRLGMERLPKPLSPRQMTILYKRIFFDRTLLRQVDAAFASWMEEVGFGNIPGLDDADMVYWEHRFPGWGALALNEFDMCWETTLPFNNRRLIEMFLAFPRTRRISDYAHREVVKLLDPELSACDVHIVNFSKQRGRVALERLFFEINSRLP